jgi:TRAP-type C4-dicarboxylate transport system permease small subunit
VCHVTCCVWCVVCGCVLWWAGFRAHIILVLEISPDLQSSALYNYLPLWRTRSIVVLTALLSFTLTVVYFVQVSRSVSQSFT